MEIQCVVIPKISPRIQQEDLTPRSRVFDTHKIEREAGTAAISIECLNRNQAQISEFSHKNLIHDENNTNHKKVVDILKSIDSIDNGYLKYRMSLNQIDVHQKKKEIKSQIQLLEGSNLKVNYFATLGNVVCGGYGSDEVVSVQDFLNNCLDGNLSVTISKIIDDQSETGSRSIDELQYIVNNDRECIRAIRSDTAHPVLDALKLANLRP